MPGLVTKTRSNKFFFETSFFLVLDTLIFILYILQRKWVKSILFFRSAGALIQAQFQDLLETFSLTLFFFLFKTNFVENGLSVNQARQIVAFYFIVALLYELSDFLFLSANLNQVSVLEHWVRGALMMIPRCRATPQLTGPCWIDFTLWHILLHFRLLTRFNLIVIIRRRLAVRRWVASLVPFVVSSSEKRFLLFIFKTLSSEGVLFIKV